MTSKLSVQHASWFAKNRGISKETLNTFGVYSDKDVVCFPYPLAKGHIKKRKGLSGERKFWWDPPLKGSVPLYCGPAGESDVAFLVEGESDTLKLWQEFNANTTNNNIPIYGLSGVNGFKAEHANVLSLYNRIFCILDNDTAYETAKQGEKAWADIRQALGNRVSRVRLPSGVKDVCEFFETYTWLQFSTLLKDSLTPSWHYQPTNLIQSPKFKWLAEPFIAHDDVVVMYGEPGVGKSWITMSLAKALVSGDEEWLGLPLKKHGPVLYVDEENPLDVITARFNKLGLTEAASKSLRFLWYSGVKLDKEPERLYEDAALLQPALVVLDSLSRVHSQSENSSEDMNAIFNNGIIPLSRGLGCAVVVLHHTAKPSENFKRRGPRGSSVIQAACDLSVEVRNGPITGSLSLAPSKLRRIAKFGSTIDVAIKDTSEGGVVLERMEQTDLF